VWRSCVGWKYPAADDAYMNRLEPVAVGADGAISFTAERDCTYTLTTVSGVRNLPRKVPTIAPAVAFPLPFNEDFDGVTSGGEAPFFGDMMGKWETVSAAGGRSGLASQQQLVVGKPWPILEPNSNLHSHPLTIIGDMFFESNRISADLLIEEENVGAGLALRMRAAGREEWPGLFLYIGSLPGCSADGKNYGGLPPAPTVASGGSTLCSDTYCHSKRKEGALPPGSPPVLQHWHAVSLEVTQDLVSGSVDGHKVFERVSIAAPDNPSGSGLQACVANTTIVKDGREIVGSDYRQKVLAGNSSADIEDCVAECCQDPKCKAWAVSEAAQGTCPPGRTCCWLKSGGGFNGHGAGEVACGIKPSAAGSLAGVPPSGWAGLVSTLGKSQVDNFQLTGTDPAGSHAAVTPCGGGTAAAGANLSSTPCDYLGAQTHWSLSNRTGELQLASADSNPGDLCVGGSATGNISLVACGGKAALVYSEATGRISPRGNPGLCVTAVQREQHQLRPADLVMSRCGATDAHDLLGATSSARSRGKPPQMLPQDAQQFQYRPGTGRLRHKASSCIASFPNTADGLYRDCCIALCPANTPRLKLDEDLLQPSVMQARRAERRCACLTGSVCLLVAAGFLFYLADEDAVAHEFDKIANGVFGHLSTLDSVLLLGLAVCLTAAIPSPLHPLMLIASGFLLGFWLGLTMVPFSAVGECIFFVLAKRGCKESGAAVLARRKNLQAVQSALQTGGLKLVILAKWIPPPVLTSVAMVALDVPYSQFAIATAVHSVTHGKCKTPLLALRLLPNPQRSRLRSPDADLYRLVGAEPGLRHQLQR